MFGWIEDAINQTAGWFGIDSRSQGEKNAEKLAQDDFKLQQDMFNYQQGVDQRNFEMQQDQFSKNFGLQQDKYNYDKLLQQTIFNREDNSVQRRVADLKAAGLSPVLAAGQGAGAGGIVSTTAPQGQVAQKQVNAKTPSHEMEIMRQEAANARRRASADMVMNSLMGMSQIEKTRAETRRIEEDTDNAKVRLDMDLFSAGLSDSATSRIANAYNNDTRAALELRKTKLENHYLDIQLEIGSEKSRQEKLNTLQKKYSIPVEIGKMLLDNEITAHDYRKSLNLGIRYKDSTNAMSQVGQGLGQMFNKQLKSNTAKDNDDLDAIGRTMNEIYQQAVGK